MRVRRIRMVLPARFAGSAVADARTLAQAAVAALPDGAGQASTLQVELPGMGRGAHALVPAISSAVKTTAKGR